MSSASPETFKLIADALLARAKEYLRDDLKLEGEFTIERYPKEMRIDFNNCAKIDTEGSIEISIVMGYENNLFSKIMTILLDGEVPGNEELEELTESISCEIVNIVVGNAINNPIDASLLNITTPLYMPELNQTIDNHVLAGRIETQYGAMLVLVSQKNR